MTIQIPKIYKVLFTEKKRHKVFYGGRGSGKSHNIARALLIIGAQKPTRILCTREYQNSISESVHRLLADLIKEYLLESFYEVTKNEIRGRNGTLFIFRGLHFDPAGIKSLEGVDYVWIEEAEKISNESLDFLVPTIRKPNSEIWYTFNPYKKTDPVYDRFVLNQRDDTIVRKVNYTDNPWFPEVLRSELEFDKTHNPDKYRWVWLGEPLGISDAQVFKNKFVVEDFEAPPNTQFYWGADWGFACLIGESLVSTNKGHVQLKNIKQGDMVLTREGYKKVTHFINQGVKSVYGIDFGYENSVISTCDHRFFTIDGWKRADELSEVETICVTKSSLMAGLIKDIQKANTLITSISKRKKTECVNTEYCIGISGSQSTEKSKKGLLYTIMTAIPLIMISVTLFVSRQVSTLKFTIKKISEQSQMRKYARQELCMDIQKQTGKSEGKNQLRLHKNEGEIVPSAVRLSSLQMFIKNIATLIAEKRQTLEIVKKNILARIVELPSWLHPTMKDYHAHRSVRINYRDLEEKREVFDITVENGEFFANNILVHNCDPSTLVRCFIRDKKLYIEYEAYGVGIEIDELPKFFESIPGSKQWRIYADSARPETISYMNRNGYPKLTGVKKWAGSIEEGIEFMRSFEKIVIHSRCKHTLQEFELYQYKQDRLTNEVLPIIVDKYNNIVDAIRYSLVDFIQNRNQTNGTWRRSVNI